MFKGLEHTVRCTKCQEFTIACGKDVGGYDKADNMVKKEKSECCNAEFEYIGLQPVMVGVLKVQIKKASGNPKIEKTMAILNGNSQETEVVKPKSVELETSKEQSLNEVQVPQETKEEVNLDGIEVVDWIDQRKKMNNDYMTQLLRDAMENEESDKVEFLKTNYPDVFQKSLRYIPAKLKRYFGL